MPKSIEIKKIQVSFNVADPDQKRLYEHAYSKSNSSGYIKRLIERDLAVGYPEQQVIQSEWVDDSYQFDAGGFV